MIFKYLKANIKILLHSAINAEDRNIKEKELQKAIDFVYPNLSQL